MSVGGKIENVTIYPSEFGRGRMEREEMEGPPREIFASSKREKDESPDESDEDEDEEWVTIPLDDPTVPTTPIQSPFPTASLQSTPGDVEEVSEFSLDGDLDHSPSATSLPRSSTATFPPASSRAASSPKASSPASPPPQLGKRRRRMSCKSKPVSSTPIIFRMATTGRSPTA